MGAIIVYIFILGMVLGSFYNVVAIRLSNNESIVFPASHCVNCQHKLSWYELIPVFSYIFLKGKCKKCKIHISLVYPLVELTTGLCFVLAFLYFGFDIRTIISMVLLSSIIIIFITDFKYMIILDEVLIVSSIITCLLFLINYGLQFTISQILKGILIFLIVLLIKLIGDKTFKQESLGWGDVKLSFFAGLLLGTKLGVIYIFLGSFLAFPYAVYVTIRNKNNILPFGPFLALSIGILYFFGNYFLEMLKLLMGC